MKTSLSQSIIAFAFMALLGAGCIPSATPAPVPIPVKPETRLPNEETVAPNNMETSSFVDFTQTAYDKALAEQRPIYLYFHANWCPTCKAQNPIVDQVFSSHTGEVAGFRVSYNDSDTSADESALAKTYGVTYQHTFFYINRTGQIVKKTIGSQTAEQITAELNSISQ